MARSCTGVTIGWFFMDVAFLPALSTYGRPLAQRDFGGVAVGLGVHRPHEVIPAHRHQEEYQWCLVLASGFEENSGRREESCGPGSLLVRPPDCVHAERFEATAALCLSLFPRRSWLEAQGFDALSDTYVHQRTRRALALGQAIARELRCADAAAPVAIESMLAELLTGLMRVDGFTRAGNPRWLAAALDRIEAEPSATLSLATLADDVGISAGHLARAFRATFGKSVGAYVRERRLAQAATMMRESDASLAVIAAAVGFCDQAHFTRAFKAQVGATPARYREQIGRSARD